ncbi:MAG: hypothetical protein AAF742_00375 [Pseudomonadota bacterium]
MAYLPTILGRAMGGTALCGVLLSPILAAGESLQFSPELSLEITGYVDGPQFTEQDNGLFGALIATGDISWRSDDRDVQFVLEPYLRFDGRDDERSYADLRRGYLRYFGEGWDVTVGADRVFWGVVESVNVVDVINQRDGLENADLNEKLGAPMLRFSAQTEVGDISLFYLPTFREREYPGEESRNRIGPPVDADAATFDRAGGAGADDFALRYSNRFGGFDVGLTYFYGTSRTPFLEFNAGTGALEPRYQRQRQTGLEVQYTADAWLWKLEVANVEIGEDIFTAAVGGVEYTFFDVVGSGRDVGLIGEYLYDDRNPTLSPVTPFDDDFFVGTRITWNDVADTAVLAGAIVDLDKDAVQIQAEFQRRIGDANLLEVEFRLVSPGTDALLKDTEQDTSVLVRWSRFF